MTSAIPQLLRSRRARQSSTLLVLAAITATIAQAAPPAGALIGNQASATYSDDSQVTRSVTSNTVVTTVQQVASLTVSANGTKTATAGGQVFYPHTITNTGNGPDTFALSTTSQTGSFSFSTVQYYADANGDGVPDSNTTITSTGQIAAGGTFNFVAVGTVPSSVVVGNTNALTLTATSGFNNTVSQANTDTTTITANGVINVTHAIDVAVGPSPSVTARTLSVTYTNTGNTTATNVTLADVIPSGFTYVAGSGRWSATGSTVLTDAAGGNQSGLTYDYGFTQSGRVTAVIDSVAPGASGTLTFQVNVNTGLAPGARPATASTATYTYNDGSSTVATTNTNTAQYTVQQTATVQVNDSTVASAAQGGTVLFTNGVINLGNGQDTINLTLTNNAFPAGTTFQLFKADGVTPVMDSNGDGIPDTGPMAASATLNIIVKATLPTGVHGGPYTIDLIGRSVLDSTKSDNGTDTLTSIGTSTVDLTNNTAGGPGVGAGPEGSAVATTAVGPGSTARVTLVIANSSGLADTYNLSATTDGTLATTTLPAGWSIVFRDSNNNIVSNTGVVNAGTSRTFYADVTAPATASTGFDVYFRAVSPSTSSSDALHDAITVTATRSLAMSPNNTGQTTSGGALVYTHTIVNTGNATEGDGSGSTVALSATSTAGFTSVIYWDRNNDTVLDSNDPIVTNLSQLTGGTNGASTAAGLSAGETARLFIKVSTTPGAAIGLSDTTTLTATTTGVIGSIAAPAAVSVTDTTTVVASQVTLVKMQAIDQACDGTADSAFSATNIGIGAAPGGCIRYQITATNAGGTAISGLVISDATPTYSSYHATVPAATTLGSVTAPSGGATGTVQATVGTLAPGQSATLTFGVRIDP